LIAARKHKPPTEAVVMDGELVVRGSTGPAPVRPGWPAEHPGPVGL